MKMYVWILYFKNGRITGLETGECFTLSVLNFCPRANELIFLVFFFFILIFEISFLLREFILFMKEYVSYIWKTDIP